MRFAASRVHSMVPVTLTSSTRRIVAASKASCAPALPTMPALLTRAVTGPSSRSIVSNMRRTSRSSAVSAWTRTARPPDFPISSATARARSARLR
jgi:hypothetical protein